MKSFQKKLGFAKSDVAGSIYNSIIILVRGHISYIKHYVLKLNMQLDFMRSHYSYPCGYINLVTYYILYTKVSLRLISDISGAVHCTLTKVHFYKKGVKNRSCTKFAEYWPV